MNENEIMNEKELEEEVDLWMSDSYTCTWVGPESFEDCEYCFQFDDDEARVLPSAISGSNMNKNLVLTIQNDSGSNITFYGDKGQTFKIFARKKEENQ